MKKATFHILFIASMLFAATGFSQNQKGTIAGKLTDKSTGEALIGATVQLEGTPTGTVSDIEGNYSFSVAPGSYTLVFTYISYKTEKMQVDVKVGETTFANFVMQEDLGSNEIKTVVITYTVQKSSSLALLTERKNAAQVSDGISADQIRKTPDRTTSDVLKRVTGASIQEGKFAVIRGMNDRYNAGYLDGAPLPSTESDRKAFAFDVVPASLLDNLTIAKTGSPDLTGDFGGGIIRINTKAVPDKFTQSVNVGGQWHALTTNKDFIQSKRYSGEVLNLFGNQRDLPSFGENDLKTGGPFPTAAEAEKLAAISQKFNNDWSATDKKALPGTRFGYSLGLPIKLDDVRKLGVIVALNYSNTLKTSDGTVNSYDGAGLTARFNDRAFTTNTSTGGIFNVNFVGAKTQVNFRNLVNVNSDNNTITRTGTGNVTDAIDVRNRANFVSVNRLVNSILSVKQVVGDNLFNVGASVNYSTIMRRTPDYRIASYTKTPDFEDYNLALGDFFNTSTGRFVSDLDERLMGGGLDLSKKLDVEKVKTTVKIGGSYQDRTRDFMSRSFVYGGALYTPSQDPAIDLGQEGIGSTKLFLIEKTSKELASYNGKSKLMAGFAVADQKYFEKFRAVWGVRFEDMDINVDNKSVDMDIADVKDRSLLPSANFSYSLSEKTNLRAAYSASVNRPEFRELAPFAFYVFDKNAEIRGNKDLKVARLNNYDIRWEFFPTGAELVSFGAFYKDIKNPVEQAIDITQPTTTFTFENEKSATNYGLELEVRKNFSFIGSKPMWRDFGVFANLAIVRSRLGFVEGSQAKKDRQLQGQSPYVLNGGLQYENVESGWFASAVVNRIGRRIAFVGVDPKFGDTRQDIFEAPRTVVDAQVGKTIGKFNVKLTAGDLLHQTLVYYQDADQNGKFDKKGDRQMFNYKNGMTVNVAVGYTF